MAGSVKVKGLRELQRAAAKSDKDTRTGVRRSLEHVARPVAEDARQRFSEIDPRSAAGFRPRVRPGRLVVEQRRRRTTGQHRQFGALQMTEALLPAAHAGEEQVEQAFERMLDDIADRNW